MPSVLEPDSWSLWPALIILKAGREKESVQSITGRVRSCWRLHRFLSDRQISLDRLRSPADATDVLDWLSLLWKRLASLTMSQLLTHRQAVTLEISQSRLSAKDQAVLCSATNYLFRLSAAEKTTRVASGGSKPIMPVTFSSHMQSAYRRLAELAATDLPVWLVGEKGTEIEPLARLVHTLRGFSENTFFRVKTDEEISLEYLKEIASHRPDTTFFFQWIDEAPLRLQETLYARMVSDTERLASAMRIIVASEPRNQETSGPSHVFHSLAAFLAPMRVAVPPLRSRVRDIEELVKFSAASRNIPDPTPRFNPDVWEAFGTYHWPGNTEELQRVVAFVVHKRPAGTISAADLPDSVKPYAMGEDVLRDLQKIAEEQKFRVVKTREGRRKVAHFLTERTSGTFTAGDIQSAFSLGRETARRFLSALHASGLIEGIRGAQNKRITRYRRRTPSK
ncbi:MAG TPA: hypothetical protein VK463_19360 [Desulfomonilaceae bacterium]|nr:hypothetical protein [Desulfomonilaceae bacterium]